MAHEPKQPGARKVPRDKANDYSQDAAGARRRFVAEETGVVLDHVGRHSFDPALLPGNIENFTGVAQVPIGLAGPLRIVGEHARGDFYIPMATTEGTLVASYNRGMRLLSEHGGVKTTVVEQYMQRSPVFLFEDALKAREFGRWVEAHFDAIKVVAEATTRVGKLSHIGQYAIGPLRYLRFNYTTGDAAGQNLTGKATAAACAWIKATHPDSPEFLLSGNIDTDKKHSQINTLLTRGKRVVAEITLKDSILKPLMGVTGAELFRARQISQAGAFMVGSANNGAHSANGITALFIATGQDVANVAESQAAITYAQLLDNGDYYWSITLTSLICATYGGGTGLATQKECLAMLGCYGQGRADKFAEICAATVLAGETSLSSAVLHGDWVSSHDQLGRNRPLARRRGAPPVGSGGGVIGARPDSRKPAARIDRVADSSTSGPASALP
ncbi:MAG: hydroxymethylglutaryl-CoA reductase [Nevskia sp.]